MPRDKSNRSEHRGFGFVTFETEAAVHRVATHGTHQIRSGLLSIPSLLAHTFKALIHTTLHGEIGNYYQCTTESQSALGHEAGPFVDSLAAPVETETPLPTFRLDLRPAHMHSEQATGDLKALSILSVAAGQVMPGWPA